MEDGFGEAIATINDPHDAWTVLQGSYGSQQSGIQAVINAELTLARWDGQTPITTHRDHMKTLRNRLAAVGLTISAIQFYQHFTNSLPAEYDMAVAIHDPNNGGNNGHGGSNKGKGRWRARGTDVAATSNVNNSNPTLLYMTVSAPHSLVSRLSRL